MSQAEGSPYEAHPIALFALIAERFEKLGLPHWTAVVFAWLARYDGLSSCYFEDAETSPTLAVYHALSDLSPGVDDEAVAASLASLEFLNWRIRHPDSDERWDPTVTSLMDFLGDKQPICWKWAAAWPSPAAVQEWLLEQLPKP